MKCSIRFHTIAAVVALTLLMFAVTVYAAVPLLAQDETQTETDTQTDTETETETQTDTSADDEESDDEEAEEPIVDPVVEGEIATLNISNATEYPFLMLFVSPADTDYFGPDLLGDEDVLEPGETREITVHADDDCFDYDVLAIDADGFPLYSILEVCSGAEEDIRLGADGILEEDVPLERFMRVDVTNTREEAITSLYASAVDSRYLGADLLSDTGELEPDDTRSFYLADSEAVSYNILARTAGEESIATKFHLHSFGGTETEVVQVDIGADLPVQ